MAAKMRGLMLFILLWFIFYTVCMVMFLSLHMDHDVPTHNTLFHRSTGNLIRLRPTVASINRSGLRREENVAAIPETKDFYLSRLRTRLYQSQKFSPTDKFGFNVNVSDNQPVLRNIEDTRLPKCKEISYDLSKFPMVSVVTPMFNEPLSTLFRHVHSLLSRTPEALLTEILIVDDNSTFAFLDQRIERYFDILDSRIKVLRNPTRQGLVVSRMNGARAAKGEVIVFLDSHSEVGDGWLEPLLQELVEGGRTVLVQPDARNIDAHTFEISKNSELYFRGGFSWDLQFQWFFVPNYITQSRISEADKIPTPVLTGCAVAVWREHFMATGGFDEELQIWGGEHFDLSFKTWMTGGNIFTVPCSKVGHVYKYGGFLFGDGFKDILIRNLARVAEIWMDEYKEIFFATQRLFRSLPIFSDAELTSLIKRKHLRKQLKSESFNWFLSSIMPEMTIPSKDDVYYGEIENVFTKMCLKVSGVGYMILTNLCGRSRLLPANHFSINKHGQFVHDTKCITPTPALALKETSCCTNQTNGVWAVSPGPLEGLITFRPNRSGHSNHTPLCLVPQRAESHVHAVLTNCDSVANNAFWRFDYYLQFKTKVASY